MTDGLQLCVPGLNSAPSVNAQDVWTVTTVLGVLADNLDKRLAALEKTRTVNWWGWEESNSRQAL
jgi:hypothetical protein